MKPPKLWRIVSVPASSIAKSVPHPAVAASFRRDVEPAVASLDEAGHALPALSGML